MADILEGHADAFCSPGFCYCIWWTSDGAVRMCWGPDSVARARDLARIFAYVLSGLRADLHLRMVSLVSLLLRSAGYGRTCASARSCRGLCGSLTE